MKVTELSGAQLDYWVARANGAKTVLREMKVGDEYCAIETVPNAIKPFPACIVGFKVGRGKYPALTHWYYPSTVWNHGGPIIERELIEIVPWKAVNGVPNWAAQAFESRTPIARHAIWGDTPLIAGMRCYVASKFGEEVAA